MQRNEEELQRQYRRDLDAALDHLTASLKPFVERELRSMFGQNWEDKVSRMGGRKPNLNDPSALLGTMLNQRWDVFQGTLGHKGKNLVGELKGWRNVPAHRDELSLEDVIRSLDSMIRLLELLPPLQPTNGAAAGLQGLKSRKLELELQRLEHLISPRKEQNVVAPTPVVPQLRKQSIGTSSILEAEITEPMVLLRIDNSYRMRMTAEELYEVTRGDWKIAPEKHFIQPQYAIAVAFRVIREVYEIHDWHPLLISKWYVGGTGYGRQRFDGVVASDKGDLIGKRVESYIHPRSSSPITYVNC